MEKCKEDVTIDTSYLTCIGLTEKKSFAGVKLFSYIGICAEKLQHIVCSNEIVSYIDKDIVKLLGLCGRVALRLKVII